MAVALALLLATGTACADTVSPGDAATSPTRAAATPSQGAGHSSSSPSQAPVPEVLDFTAPLLGGGTVNGASYAGKDLAIWFWAPW